MTYTRTFTVEELALRAMIETPPRKVRLDTSEGIITGLRREFADEPGLTVTFMSDGGSEIEFTLAPGRLEFL